MTHFWDTVKGFVTQSDVVIGLPHLIELAEDPSGYKRENAVRRLGMLGDPAALDSLLRRANDWVPQVRLAALHAIRQLMIPTNANAFVSSLPEIFHLEQCGRASHRALIEEISNFLADPNNSSSILLGLEAAEPRVRRLCYDIAFTYRIAQLEDLAGRAVRDHDVVVQRRGISRLKNLDSQQSRAVLTEALRSPTAGVREAALRIYLKMPSEDVTVHTAYRCALDSSNAVRGVAMGWLRDQGADVSAVLLETVRQADSPARKVRAGILAIAEIHRKDLLSEILHHLESDYPSIRAAVLAATARLDADHARDLCEKALEDSSPGVVRLASKLLTKLGVRFEARRLIELVRKDSREVVRRAATYLSRHSNKWERLVYLLRMAEPLGAVVSINNELSDWNRSFNRSAVGPTSEQLAELRSLIDESEPFMSAKERSELSFALTQARAR